MQNNYNDDDDEIEFSDEDLDQINQELAEIEQLENDIKDKESQKNIQKNDIEIEESVEQLQKSNHFLPSIKQNSIIGNSSSVSKIKKKKDSFDLDIDIDDDNFNTKKPQKNNNNNSSSKNVKNDFQIESKPQPKLKNNFPKVDNSKNVDKNELSYILDSSNEFAKGDDFNDKKIDNTQKQQLILEDIPNDNQDISKNYDDDFDDYEDDFEEQEDTNRQNNQKLVSNFITELPKEQFQVKANNNNFKQNRQASMSSQKKEIQSVPQQQSKAEHHQSICSITNIQGQKYTMRINNLIKNDNIEKMKRRDFQQQIEKLRVELKKLNEVLTKICEKQAYQNMVSLQQSKKQKNLKEEEEQR